MNHYAKKPLARVSTTHQVWNGFNMCRGHVYGEDDKGPFVTGTQRTNAGIIVYRAVWGVDCYKWGKVIEPASTETGRAILAAVATRHDGVTMGEQSKRSYSPCVFA